MTRNMQETRRLRASNCDHLAGIIWLVVAATIAASLPAPALAAVWNIQTLEGAPSVGTYTSLALDST